MIIGTTVGGPTNGLGTPLFPGAPDLDNIKLIQNVNFKCDPGKGPAAHSCYGVGATHGVFVALQQQINRFAGIAPAFTPILVDGFIGTGTVAALVAAMTKSGTAYLGFSLDPGFAGLTKEKVAANAATLASRLNAAATVLAAPPAQPVPQAQQTPIATGQVVPSGQGGGIPQTPPGTTQVQVDTTASVPADVKVLIDSCQTDPEGLFCKAARTACKRLPSDAPQAKKDVCAAIGVSGGPSNTVWWVVGGLATLAVVGIVTATVIRAKKRRKGASPSFAAPHFGNDVFPFPY